MMNSRLCIPFLLSIQLIVGLPAIAAAQEVTPGDPDSLPERAPGEPMTVDRMDAIVAVIDPAAERDGNVLAFQFVTEDDLAVVGQIISDVNADRMRIIIGITGQDDLSPELLKRILQANFDSALDARYALAQGYLWSTFIHPLSPLADEEFISGLSQTITLSLTFGTTFTSGALIYQGGDSADIEKDIQEELEKDSKPRA